MAQAGNSTPDVYPTLGGQTYDWPIWQAIAYVRAVIGEEDNGTLFRETRKAIRQAALDSRIGIFGRKELPPPKHSGYASDVWTSIPPHYWATNELGPLVADQEWKDHEHTRGEPLGVDGYRERYWALLVNRDEIARTFPCSQSNRPSHAGLVQWCRKWIADGRGNGMDKAWPDFKSDPAHQGLSRDDAFRPAWREAKTKQIKA